MPDKTPERLRDSQMGLGLEEEVVGASLPDEAAVRRAPHKEPTTPGEWVKENLFSSPFNTILTLVFAFLGAFLAFQLVKFVFFGGQWSVFKDNARSYMTGRWPLDEMWRIWVSIYAVGALAGITYGMSGLRPEWTTRRKVTTALLGAFALFVFVYVVDTVTIYLLFAAAIGSIALGRRIGQNAGQSIARSVMWAWIVAFPLIMILYRGFGGVPPRLWGGFILNITVAVVGIFVSFPIGLMLALGRRSSLPVIRAVSTATIELVRGNPLYILLTAGIFLLPLLLPPGLSTIPPIIRAMAIFVIFSSAYVAEIVRGGLQGVDDGQYEASKALGLSTSRMMALVILPQALRSTIPAMISHFISLFKDTSLLAAIPGFTDLLRSARRASAGLGQAGSSLEALVPAAMFFFIVAYAMSRWSQRVEQRVGVGER